MEGLIYERKICVSKSIGLALEGNLPFLLCFTLCLRAISKYKPPRGLYLEGRFNGGFFALRVWGAYIWRSLNMKGLIFGTLRYSMRCFNMSVIYMDTAQDMQPNRIRECL